MLSLPALGRRQKISPKELLLGFCFQNLQNPKYAASRVNRRKSGHLKADKYLLLNRLDAN